MSIRSFFIALLFSAVNAWAAVPGLSLEMETMLWECAPNVHPETMAAVVNTESSGNRFAIADAGPLNLPWSQRKKMVRSFFLPTLPEAVATARTLINQGHTVSLGPAQLNDRQLPRLGLSLEEAFDPCTNIRGGGVVLGRCYEAASKKFGKGQRALRAALSCYNSGDMVRGEKDGYVDLVYANQGKPLVLKVGATKRLSTDGGVSSRSVKTAAANYPWWKGAGPRPFTMSSREFQP